MKKKYLAIVMGLMVGASVLAGCGTDQSADSSAEEETVSQVYGEITALGDSSFTLDSGMGDTMEVTVTDDTEFTTLTSAGGSGGMQGGGDMEMQGSGAPGDAPADGDGGSDAADAGEPENADGGESDSSDAESADGSDAENGDESADTLSAGSGDESAVTLSAGSGESDGSDAESGDGSADTGDRSGAPDNADGGTPPDMPSDGDSADGDMPDMPSDGGSADGEMPDLSSESGDSGSGTSASIDFDDLSVGDVVAVTCDADGNATSVLLLYSAASEETASMGDGGSTSSASGITYTAVNEYTADAAVDGETISSAGADENAILISDGAAVTITDCTVTRDSDGSTGGDDASFYGVGAAILAADGTAYISDTTIDTDAAGGAGVFAYGDSVVYVADCTITTQQGTSGGIHAAGGGTLYAWNLAVETNGGSAAAIRSDRGGGTMVVDEGTYTSNGGSSPAVYCTADIAVHDAALTATASEAVCIEGLNSLRLYDCDLTGSMPDDSQNDCTWNVILYQSMSGDSEVGNSVFEMVGGSLTAENGGMFYTTNTESTFTLSGVDITYAEDSEFFLRCTGNDNERGWGSSGSNGADCLFTAIDQEMEGDVIWDSISQLDFYLTDGSTLTGAVLDDETYAGNGGDGSCNLYIGSGCTWIVTGDSVLSGLQNAGTIEDVSGNTVTIQGTDGTVYVQGTSQYTITVDSYEDDADLSGASAVSAWSDYEVERPDEI
ncbi:MAG: hypothetical protein LIO75_04385 [Lachnospiraceae bacterium]|nr:hypothetical protein [Lachnospiraceae bacterium]